MYAITSSRSSKGTISCGIDGCGLCSQTARAVPVMPGLFAISLEGGSLWIRRAKVSLDAVTLGAEFLRIA